MIALNSGTSAAIALHAAELSWVVFLQTELPGGIGAGRIKIEGLRGKQLASRFSTLARECPYEIYLIGMIPTTDPGVHSSAIAEQHPIVHDGWFEATADLIAFIAAQGQPALISLVEKVHPGAFDQEQLVDIEQLAQMLDVAPITIRRMIERRAIPYYRVGRAYKFKPSEVLASLR